MLRPSEQEFLKRLIGLGAVIWVGDRRRNYQPGSGKPEFFRPNGWQNLDRRR